MFGMYPCAKRSPASAGDPHRIKIRIYLTATPFFFR